MRTRLPPLLSGTAVIALATMLLLPHQAAASYDVRNLVSNNGLPGTITDPDLVNAWGMSFPSGGGPFWVSDNGSGVATLYNGNGAGSKLGLTVTIPPSPSAPTGQVFNPTTDFGIGPAGAQQPGRFIFASENGVISAWNPAIDPTHAQVGVDRSSTGAVYKGIAIGSSGGQNFLYATNFTNGTVDMIDKNFNVVKQFTDPSIPSNFAPFNASVINGSLYVTYAEREPGGIDDVKGLGNGYVVQFATDGTVVARIATQGTLDSPWGLARAPDGFGPFSGALLVGNFGNGTINAFDWTTHAFLGQLTDASGKVISIDGLWSLVFGNDGQAGSSRDLFFTAGPDDEMNGLFGRITIPEPATLALLGGALLLLFGVARKAR
jgi:uncharacterized protein (TIGR03118 family)